MNISFLTPGLERVNIVYFVCFTFKCLVARSVSEAIVKLNDLQVSCLFIFRITKSLSEFEIRDFKQSKYPKIYGSALRYLLKVSENLRKLLDCEDLRAVEKGKYLISVLSYFHLLQHNIRLCK